MKGYESIPSITAEEGTSSSASLMSSADKGRRHPALVRWTAATIALLVLIAAPFALNGNSNENLGSLRSASAVVMLPNPPPAPKPPKGKIYNNNTHVKLLSFRHQRVDHFRADIYETKPEYWSQPYYQTTEHWKGPGSPIFCIIGGEAYQDHGFIYPFVSQELAQHFGAAVIQPEHRFYGVKKPVPNATKEQLLQLLTVEQALADVVALTHHVAQHELGCHMHDKSSPHYCPIITVGGSYAAFLSAMARMVYPDYIDMAYSASGPILMYGQLVDDPNVYYDIMTQAYDHASPGCAAAIKDTLLDMNNTIQHVARQTNGSLSQAAQAVGVCGELPAYITTPDILADALVEISSSRFHDAGLFSYPPGKDTGMYKICSIFQFHEDPLKDFLFTLLQSPFDFDTPVAPPECFDLNTQVPKDGKTVDDTPDDANHDGIVWDFQVCTDLTFIFGYSDKSMLPPKKASYETLFAHCLERFGVTPRPWELVDKYDFGDLSSHSNILFTNGMQDCWSGGGITWNVSDTVLSLFFPNGAHHSDLTLGGPTDRDTDDLKYGYVQIKTILGTWIDNIGK